MVADVVLAAALGGLLWLDRFQFGQVMVSRPLVAASIIGWALNDVVAGFHVGILFELLWLTRPPVGGYVPPDGVFAAIAAAACAAIAHKEIGCSPKAAAMTAMLWILPCAHLGKRIDKLMRMHMDVIAAQAEKKIKAGALQFGRFFAHALAVGFIAGFLGLAPVISIGTVLCVETLSLSPSSFIRALEFGYFLPPCACAVRIVVESREKSPLIAFVTGLAVTLGAAFLLHVGR
jgi:PTS system mannose-specific IIC component